MPEFSAAVSSSPSGAGMPALTASCGHGPGCSISSQARDASGAEAMDTMFPAWHSAPCSQEKLTRVDPPFSSCLFMLVMAGGKRLVAGA